MNEDQGDQKWGEGLRTKVTGSGKWVHSSQCQGSWQMLFHDQSEYPEVKMDSVQSVACCQYLWIIYALIFKLETLIVQFP